MVLLEEHKVNYIGFKRARCHYGHHAGLRCPWMSEYLFGTRRRTDIIDLEKTVPLFQQALNFIAHVACRGGVFNLFFLHNELELLVVSLTGFLTPNLVWIILY